MKTLDDIKLEDILPDSIKNDPGIKSSSQAIDPELKAAGKERLIPAVFASIDRLESVQLDHLAAQFDMTTWRDSWPVYLKRQVAKTLGTQKCRMGTLSAIKKVLSSLGAAVRISEWWQEKPKAEPHTFKVIVSLPSLPGLPDIQTQEDFFALLDEAKPVRSHYTFTIAQSGKADIFLESAGRPLAITRHISRQQPEKGFLLFLVAGRPVSFARHTSI